MEGLFERVTATASVFAGVISFCLVMATVIRSYYTRKRKIKKAEAETISSVLVEDDITKLGAYVDNVIGPFDMREYATDSEVERIVDAYIERVQEYIGAPEDIEREREEAPPQPPDSSPNARLSAPPGVPTHTPRTAVRRIVERLGAFKALH